MSRTDAALATTGWDSLPVHDHGAPVLRDRAETLAVSHQLGELWAQAGPERDADGVVPRAELGALGASGLLGIMVPASFGGPGAATRTLVDVFATLAAADLSLAQVPQNHFGTVYGLAGFDEARQAFWYGEALRGARFGNANAEIGRRDRPATTLSNDPDDPSGYVLDGTKRFATGAMTADWVTVGVAHDDGWRATVMLPAGTPGVAAAEDWDAFGQRSTHSGTITFDAVRVSAAQVLDQRELSREATAFRYSRSQLTHSALQIGSTEGVLTLAARWAAEGRVRRTAAFEAWLEETTLEVAAARALAGRAADGIDELAAVAERGGPLDPEAVMRLGVAVDESKVIAYELGPASADRLAGFAPPDALTEGVDRWWRNARTHALHDPVRWRRHYVGAYHLRGEFLPHAQWIHTSATTPQ